MENARLTGLSPVRVVAAWLMRVLPAFMFLAGMVGLSGCGDGSLAALYGFDSGSGNPNTGGQAAPEGTTRLAPITFSPTSGFPQGEDPAVFELGGGTITTVGGSAGTLGRFGLYADDPFAWDFFAGASGTITFEDLEVVAIDGYWVHPDSQDAGASMTVNFSDGSSSSVPSVPVNASGPLGQTVGFFDSVSAPEGETISGLDFEFDDGAGDSDVAVLDLLELTVLE